ncbi:MAG TPA: aldehyde dehydrogenase family protein, partial [Gemmatimonadaceae bacterium]
RVSQGSAADVNAAVAAARAALPGWAGLPGHARARWLYALARAVQRHSRLLAVVETLDNGKSVRETRDLDIPLVARHFYHHAGWAQLAETEFAGYGPVGVVGQIIPWNFPLLMLAWKVAPALAAGCTVVLKPAEYTPLTALLFAELAQEAGLPAGVLNVVTGDGETGKLIVEHDNVDKIAFTGSTEVGRQIRRATAGTGKKLSLELGGKSPFLVFDDADLDGVVEGVVDAIWFNQGQVCCAGSRLLAQEGIAEQLEAKLRARMERLRVGPPLDKAVDMGAIVAPVQLERIRALVQQGVDEGATCWQPSWACPQDGWFYPPTLFTNVAPSSTIAQVEIFGPVLASMTFRTPEEGVALANNTPYGLAASLWTENINLALDVAPKLKAGVVWINATNLFDAAAGFGGYRESGFGREGGREGMWEYLVSDQRSAVSDQGTANGDGRDERGDERGRELDGERGAPPEHHDGVARDPEQHPSDAPDTTPPHGDPLRDEIPAVDRVGRFDPRDAAHSSLDARRSPLPSLDRTPKLFIGGRQARPDSGYSIRIRGADGALAGEVGEGNRKDVRNAVEAAHAAAKGWARATAHNRAQILYYIAENLAARGDDFVARLRQLTGESADRARCEVETTVSRLFTYGAWADKYDGAVHSVPIRGVALAMHEPVGVLALAAPERVPLLGFVSLVAPAIAMGNTVVAVPSERAPLAATDFYSVLETSDVPAGVVNIVTGATDALMKVLAEHDDVDGAWYFGPAEGIRAVEYASASNMKRTWCEPGDARDWLDARQGEGREFLRHATEVKNVWVPYGE